MKQQRRLGYASARGFGRPVFIALCLVMWLLPGSAHATSCLYPDKATGAPPNYSCLKPVERGIVELRKFRAEITVAALRCNQQRAYNNFVTRHHGELASRGKLLRAIFQRQYGTAGMRELNRYVTHLTNMASMRSLGVRRYCRSMTQVFAEGLRTPIKGLMAFIHSNPLARAESRQR